MLWIFLYPQQSLAHKIIVGLRKPLPLHFKMLCLITSPLRKEKAELKRETAVSKMCASIRWCGGFSAEICIIVSTEHMRVRCIYFEIHTWNRIPLRFTALPCLTSIPREEREKVVVISLLKTSLPFSVWVLQRWFRLPTPQLTETSLEIAAFCSWMTGQDFA